MLPFLSKKLDASVAVTPDAIKRESDTEQEVDSLETAMQELFAAKSDKERAAAFRAAFDLLEIEPHAEADH